MGGPGGVTAESVPVQVLQKGLKEEHSLDVFINSAMLTSFCIFSL